MPDSLSNRRLFHYPALWVGATTLLGVLITAWVTHQLWTQEQRLAEEQFRQEAEVLRGNVERETKLFIDVLNSIRALHDLSGEISADALEEFVQLGMVHQREVLGAFGFAQRIGHAVRQSLEQAYEESPSFGYRIVELSPPSSFIPAATRPLYFPLTWESSKYGLYAPIGFDFASVPAAWSAIEQMQLLGDAVLVTDPIPTATSDVTGHWAFTPIFYTVDQDPDPVNIMIGFAIGRIEPTTLLERVATISRPSPGLTMTFAPESMDLSELQQVGKMWIYRQPIQFFDQTWVFICELPVPALGRAAWIAAIAGLLVTLLVSSQLLLITNRTRRIENEVHTRTRDLREAKHELEIQMHERARLEEEMSDLAMHERQRLGRDLHDSLGQKLTGAVMLSRVLLRHTKEVGGEPETHASTLNETLKESVGQVRALAKGLAPVTLSDESLADALSQLGEEMTSLYGVSCEYTGPTVRFEIDGKIKEQLYLIAREATNNAARHSGASHVWLNLHQEPDGTLVLSVADDGKGLPETEPLGGGMGLRIMRHRSRMIAGELRIQPRPGGGTTVTAHCRSKQSHPLAQS